MSVYLVLVKVLFFPMLLYVILFAYKFKSKRSWLIFSMFTIIYSTPILLYTDWSAIGHYVRIIMILVLIINLFLSFWRHKRVPWIYKGTSTLFGFIQWIFLVVGIILVTLTGLRTIELIIDKPPSNTLEISFPLKGEGIYSITHGGNTSALNYHYAYPSQKYAVDIVKLNKLGIRKDLFSQSSNLKSYSIYGEPVYSPVNGLVVMTINDVSDEMKAVHTNTRANMIVIAAHDVLIYLLHLQKDSIQVKEGEWILEGQKIARVGNSGYSTEPHLHIHAVRKVSDKESDISVPLVVKGKSLKRNDLVKDGNIIFR